MISIPATSACLRDGSSVQICRVIYIMKEIGCLEFTAGLCQDGMREEQVLGQVKNENETPRCVMKKVDCGSCFRLSADVT